MTFPIEEYLTPLLLQSFQHTHTHILKGNLDGNKKEI